MSAFKDTMIITQRQLRLLTRVPEVLVFSTIQPVMFVLLFRYVFGGSIDSGQPGGYVQLLMPGIFVQTVAFTLAGTAVGLAEDLKKGLIDRFRSLPISQSALVVGRMPRALQYFAEWNPVSTMVAACRELFGLENQFGATAGSFPSENPLITSFIYMIIIMAIFIPISVRKYKRAAD